MEEDQERFRNGRGCVDHIFIIKLLVDKYREQRKELYVLWYEFKKGV